MRIGEIINGEIVYRDMTPQEEQEAIDRQKQEQEKYNRENRAHKRIAKGEFFYHDGELCKAKTSIANGAMFTLNTNYIVVNVADELSKLNA